MNPHSNFAFSDSSLRSLYRDRTNDIVVSDCEEVSNHELLYNLLDKNDISNLSLSFSKKVTGTPNDKEPGSPNEKFKYKPRFLVNKFDGSHMTLSENSSEEMQTKKIVSLTAVLKPNQPVNTSSNSQCESSDKNDLEINKNQLNSIIGSESVAERLEKLSTELYLLGVEAEKNNNETDTDGSINFNINDMQFIKSAILGPSNSTNQDADGKCAGEMNCLVEAIKQEETNGETNEYRGTKFPGISLAFPRKINKIEKRIKNLEKTIKKIKNNVKSLHKWIKATPAVDEAPSSSKAIEFPQENNKENIPISSKPTRITLNRDAYEASKVNTTNLNLENPYDEVYYEFRQQKMNMLHYKKSERSILFNQYPLLRWGKPELKFNPADSKLPRKPKFIRTN